MIDLHYWPTPNGWKISIALEEMELPYRVVPVNIGRGDQFTPEFMAISPNNRMPAIVDHEPLSGAPFPSLFSSMCSIHMIRLSRASLTIPFGRIPQRKRSMTRM